MGIGNTIKRLREEKNLTKVKLGSLVGVSAVSVDNWEKEIKKPSADAIISLSRLFNISTDRLLDVALSGEYVLSEEEFNIINTYRELDDAGKEVVATVCTLEKKRIENYTHKTNNKIRYIPKFLTPAAAGITIPYEGEEYEMIPVDDVVPSDVDFAVRIQGDSMLPFIKDGDTVYVKKDTELSIGDIGIFSVDGMIYCKQYFLDNERNLLLKSSNHEFEYADVYVDKNSGSDVRVLGKVITNPTTVYAD